MLRTMTLINLLTFAALGMAVVPAEARQSGAPLPPMLLTANALNGVASLEWLPNAAGSAPTTYQLLVGTDPGVSNVATVTAPAGQTRYTAMAPPGSYYVRVIAANALGVSAPSNEILVIVSGVVGCGIPVTPTGLAVTVAGALVTLRWDAPSSGGAPTGYVLQLGSFAGGSDLGSFGLGLTTTITAPAPPGQYFARLVAANACGGSAPSAERSFTVGGGS